jgi:hypothetical protein
LLLGTAVEAGTALVPTTDPAVGTAVPSL